MKKGKTAMLARIAVVLALVASLVAMTAAPAAAAPVTGVTVTVSDLRAGKNAQYSIGFTNGATGADALAAGTGSIIINFPTGTTVPASIAASTIQVTNTTAATTAALTVAPVVSGRTVTLTTPIAIGAADGVSLIFSPTAGLMNPTTPRTYGDAASTRPLTVSTSTDATLVSPAAAYTIASWVTISPTSAARGGTVAVTAGGLAPNTTGTIMLAGVSTGATALIDGSGNFSGSFTAGAGTSAGGPVTVVDGNGVIAPLPPAAGPAYTQNASATPRVTEATPGQTVSVDLLDFTAVAGNTIADPSTLVAGTLAANSPAGAFAIATGSTGSLAPYRFVVPVATTTGVKNVVIVETGGTKTATFQLTIVQRTLTVTPTSAAPGSSISISGTGFTAGGAIAPGSLTLTGGTPVNAGVINIDTSGNFLFTGTVPTADASVATTGAKTFTALDGAGLIGTSSGFTLPGRALTISPTTAVPGSTLALSGTGMTVGTGTTVTITNTFDASVSVFPINADGTWSGSVNVPATAAAGTITYTATDNALTLGLSATNKAAVANLTIANGTITVSPTSGPTGTTITITGANFPANLNVAVLTVGGGNALPTPAPTTSSTGTFTVNTRVPAAAAGGSLPPGAVVIAATVGAITGSTSFTIPSPVISISPTTVSAGGTLTVTGSNFSALTPLTVLTIGAAAALPSPAPMTNNTGSFTATVLVPALNVGTYTLTVTTTAPFTANTTVTISEAAPAPVTPTTVLAALVTANALNVAFSPDPANPGSFLSFIPDVPGNTLASVASFQTVIINVTVAGQAIPAGFRGQPGQTALDVGVNFLTYAP